MDTAQIFEVLPFTAKDLLMVVKMFYLLGLFGYCVFAFLVVRQAKMMMESLGGKIPLPVKEVVWGHLIVALLVFVLAAVVL